MKSLPLLLALLIAPLHAQTATSNDPFEKGIRDAWAEYKKGNNEAVTTKLRELLKIMEDKGAEEVAEVLPAQIEYWKGETMKREDLGALGGGLSLSRLYKTGEREVTVKVVKDSPLVKRLLPMIANKELLRFANRETHRISGETGVMDGEKKLQMVLDERIYLELTAEGEAGEKDLLFIAKKLDLKALEKIK